MPVDRELLNAPVAKLREMLEANEVGVYDAPDWLQRKVRAQFRFDLATLGIDPASEEQLAGAIVGYGVALKALLTFVVPPELVSQFVSFFDCIEPLLDEDIDAQVDQASDGDFWESIEEAVRKNLPPEDPEAPTINQNRERMGLPPYPDPAIGERRVRNPFGGGQPVPDIVRKAAKAQGLDIPEDATMTDMTEQARRLSEGQPSGGAFSAEWKIEEDPEYGYRATHASEPGAGVVAPTLEELHQHMAEMNAALIRKAAGERNAPPLTVGGPEFNRIETAEAELRATLAAVDEAIQRAQEARARLAEALEQ
jgi:hypothetical protein